MDTLLFFTFSGQFCGMTVIALIFRFKLGFLPAAHFPADVRSLDNRAVATRRFGGLCSTAGLQGSKHAESVPGSFFQAAITPG